ncbi:Ger(x)C family spore germination protein [Marinicrinis lubricantis]|uniref:Ger(X)C family spore germination protein n=1 Tax=Marinicrinis lubricantis TaxID=2086470 RepID=A0ABW1IQ48_9BACL
MRRRAVALLIIMILLVTTGCWSRRELNELALVVGLSIDAAPNNQFDVMVQVVIPSQISTQDTGGGRGGGQTTVTSYEARNKSIFEAFREMKTSAPRRLYFSHLRILILGNDLAEKGIANALESLTRDPEFRSDFYVAIARDHKASDYLKIMTQLEQIPANKLFDSLELAQRIWSEAHAITGNELINDMISLGKEAAITTLSMTGSKEQGMKPANVELIDPPVRMKFRGLAALRRDKVVGYLDTNESRGYNYITNNVHISAKNHLCPEQSDYWVLEVRSAKSKIKTQINQGLPTATIKIEMEGDISEYRCKEDLTNPKTINTLEQINDEEIEKMIMKSVKKAQSLRSDIFGVGENIHKQHPKVWKQLKSDWPSIFSDMKFEIECSTTIQRTGTLNKSFLNQLEGH